MTARLTACHDLADNEPDLMKIEEFFMTLQNSATLVSLLLPWFPSQARKAIKQATTDIYAILYTYVENRRHAEPESANAIDILIVDGATTQNIIGVSLTPDAARDFARSDSTSEVCHGRAFRWHS